MTDLLPCPFCGSTNLRHEFAGSQGFIECNECGTVGPCDERAADPICDIEAAADAWNRRPAALAADGPAVPEGREPASVVGDPSDEELIDFQNEWFQSGRTEIDVTEFQRATLARWGQPLTPPADRHAAPVPVPVPVAERLPRPEDCDAEGRCWMIYARPPKYTTFWELLSMSVAMRWGSVTHWLPAHALPLPAPQGGEVEP